MSFDLLKNLCNCWSAQPVKRFKISALRKSYLPVFCRFKSISSRVETTFLSGQPTRKAASARVHRWSVGWVVVLVACKDVLAFQDVVFIRYTNELQTSGDTTKIKKSLFRFYISPCAGRNKDNGTVLARDPSMGLLTRASNHSLRG